MKKIFLPILVLSIFLVSLQAQKFQIMRFGIEDGLLHESTFSLVQDNWGYIWVSTTQGLCRMDGKNFSVNFLGDTLPSTPASASFKDSRGRLWFGHTSGEISYLNKNHFKVFDQEIEGNSPVVGFAESEKGEILALTQRDGLVIFDANLDISSLKEPFSGMPVSDLALTDEGNLLIGGFDGLNLFIPDGSGNYVNKGRIKGIPYARVTDIKRDISGNTFWLGAEDEGLFLVQGTGGVPEDYKVVQKGVDQGLQYSNVYSILVDRAGYLWVSDYGKGVYRFKISAEHELRSRQLFSVEGGMPEEYIKDILLDDEGNIWFASQSNGIAVLRDQAFTFHKEVAGIIAPEITSVCLKGNDYWLGTRKGQLIWSDGDEVSLQKVYSQADGLPMESISALWQDEQANLYIGTESSGLFKLDRSNARIRQFFRADNSLGNMINAIDGDSNSIWVATNDGIYQVGYSGQLTGHQSTKTGLPHNVINDVLLSQNGCIWIATRGSGLYCINRPQEEFQDYIMEGDPKLEFTCLAEDGEGNIWAGTYEDGAFKFTLDAPVIYSVDQGLKAKYTYAIDIDPKGFVWVGHRLGLSKIDPGSGNIVVFDQEMGFTSDILYRAIDLSEDGEMLFGTNDGLITYDTYRARSDTVAPRLNITELNISDSLYDATNDIKLPYGAYKIRFDFIGINLSNPDQVTYRYKLDGFDDWSEPTRDTYAKYSRIEDGEYTFMISACDGNGNCTGETAMIKISVKIPIWKAWWFILTIILSAVIAVYSIIKIRERNQKALQEYLEDQLDQRTREVRLQKEEIEIKNRDITDSINYAQRIQASILPPIKRLHQTFSGSFVFYQPRDIVSGDFYWYDKLDDERFMIVCADSTGHGVPGAFMSMIGTTLIKDICLRSDVSSPSDVLRTLDKEVREALNQNVETDGSNDGMDIIVAEINLRTNRFVISSAMRPVILYVGGEQVYVKGSRSSVGGQLDEAGYDKEFLNEEYQLEKGDIIYMFSDGYPDQFGGPLGRKFKMVRLKNLLRDIHDKSMEEQYNYVKSNFFLWKEDLEQVDDVLFMGIKI